MSFSMSGVLVVDCPNEPFIANGEIVLTNNLYGHDCIKKTLEAHDTTLVGIDYDENWDEIQVHVKYSVLPITMNLFKTEAALLDVNWPAQADNCKNSNDQAIWKSKGKEEFAAQMSDCGHQCWGGGQCSTKCIVEKFGY